MHHCARDHNPPQVCCTVEELAAVVGFLVSPVGEFYYRDSCCRRRWTHGNLVPNTFEECEGTHMTHLGEEGLSLPEPTIGCNDEEQFQQVLQTTHLMGLWNVGPEHVPRVPHPQTRPYLWRWQDLSRMAALSWHFVPADGSMVVCSLWSTRRVGRWGRRIPFSLVFNPFCPARRCSRIGTACRRSVLFSPDMEPARRWMANS